MRRKAVRDFEDKYQRPISMDDPVYDVHERTETGFGYGRHYASYYEEADAIGRALDERAKARAKKLPHEFVVVRRDRKPQVQRRIVYTTIKVP